MPGVTLRLMGPLTVASVAIGCRPAWAEGETAAAVGIARAELDAAGLRRTANRSQDAAAAQRMLALALILEGKSRTEAAQAAGMKRQTPRDWVHRYEARRRRAV